MTKPNPTRDALLTGNLTLLMALEANGLEKPASALVDKIGAGLARTPKARAHTPERISLPDEERGRSAYDLERLDRINAKLLRGYKPRKGEGGTVEEQREADLRARESLENEIKGRTAERERLRSAAEADILAAARGEEVVTDTAGVRRVLDRDPLLSLARVGKLTPDQLETGQEVRDLYDLRATDAGAMEYTGMPGGGHDHERFVANRFTRAKACEMLGRIERAVAVKCSAEPAALAMIRAICERGMSLTSQGRGRAYERNATALAKALDVADDVLKRRI